MKRFNISCKLPLFIEKIFWFLLHIFHILLAVGSATRVKTQQHDHHHQPHQHHHDHHHHHQPHHHHHLHQVTQSVWSVPGFPLAILCDFIVSGSELVSTQMTTMIVMTTMETIVILMTTIMIIII